MTDFSQDKFVDELMDCLITHGVGAAQNGLIHSLAIWLDNNIQGEFVKERKQEAGQRFSQSVIYYIEKREFQRKTWQKNNKFPFAKNEWGAIQEIFGKVLERMNGMSFEQGLDFIAHLYAAWVLSCPAYLMKHSPQYKASLFTGSEPELIDLMIRYLDIYMSM
jgi:hypothetical protein